MKKRILLFLTLTFLFHGTCLAQTPLIQDRTDHGLLQPRELSDRISLTVLDKKLITRVVLQQLKIHLQTFASFLGQKTFAAEKETTMLFATIRQLIDNVLNIPDTSLSPGDGSYRMIENILTVIENDPVMAMAYEESLRHADKPTLANIRPNKGHGATYRLNEDIKFAITANQDCFIQIFFLSSQRGGQKESILQQLIFSPDPGRESVSLSSGDSLILGEDGSFTVEPPYGNELIIVVASKEKLTTRSIAQKLSLLYPLDFEALFTGIYGKQIADKLSLHSCFLESKPPEE